ncbi:MAG: EscU/YscU/HrcU family type III secretion system export apparatus switch protein [Rhodobacteraceae bacterium]|nr:EscU/YscU/HrcU family type III secretion system export apparatus switch protein [Paracoccaceae bacterium]
MSGEKDESGEKTHEASQQKIEKSRKKGDIARSPDVSAAAAYLGLYLAFTFVGLSGVGVGAGVLAQVFANADTLSRQFLSTGGSQLAASLFGQSIQVLIPIFLLPFLAVLLVSLAQRIFVVAPDKVKPKGNRISPLQGIKNKFGVKGIVEFLKTVAKMVLVSTGSYFYLAAKKDEILGIVRGEPWEVVTMLGEILSAMVLMVMIIAMSIALVDFMWQKYHHLQKLRMTHKEVKDESKESEGDPHMKSQRRARAQEIATNQMLHDVPRADVVVVNPTHYAVALEWARTPGTAPVVIAKGVDDVARRIREVAGESGVPIHSDPPTARALHATVKIGHEIDTDHYRAIAAAIRFATEMRAKAKERGA